MLGSNQISCLKNFNNSSKVFPKRKIITNNLFCLKLIKPF